MDPRVKEALDLFIEEARDGLGIFERTLLAAERATDAERHELVNQAFRVVHSIKGSSGYFGLGAIGELSHGMEDVLARVRSGELPSLARHHLDALLAARDKLAELVEAAATGEHVELGDTAETLQECLRELDGPLHAPAPPPGAGDPAHLPAPVREVPDPFVAKVRAHGENLFALACAPGEEPALELQLQSLGRVLDRPAPGFVRFASVLEPDLVQSALEVPPDRLFLLHLADAAPGSAVAPPAAGGAHVAPAGATPPAPTSVRVSVALLDDLMNLAGELVLTRNQLLRRVAPVAAGDPELGRLSQQLGTVISALQQRITATRLQPLDTLLRRLPRMVRDLGAQLGREVELVVTGGGVELDRTVIEALSEPLLHLVRNALDHGVELPDERVRRGKPRTGTLHIEATHGGDTVQLRLSDDGRGIQPAEIVAAAVERGVVAAAEGARLTRAEALELLFLPGFSTRREVTATSGRGVGLDVVKSSVERVGGTVFLESAAGRGTTAVLTLPLSLAIVPAVIVQEGDMPFVLLQKNVAKLQRAGGDRPGAPRVVTVNGRPALAADHELLPLLRLADVLGMERSWRQPRARAARRERRRRLADRRAPEVRAQDAPLPPPEERRAGDRRSPGHDRLSVVVLEHHGHRFGLAVDAIVDSEEIVVKALPKHLAACPCYLGTTLLGDGAAAAILDVDGMVRASRLTFPTADDAVRATLAAARPAAAGPGRTWLLFETGPERLWAVDIARIRRIERLHADELRVRAGVEFLVRGDATVRVVRLDGTEPCGAGFSYLIVPDVGPDPCGLLARSIRDTLALGDVAPGASATSFGGLVIGSFVVDGSVALVPDLERACAAAAGRQP